jgi:hypothetical protein
LPSTRAIPDRDVFYVADPSAPFTQGYSQRLVKDCQADAFRAREMQGVIKFANRSHPLSPRLQRDKSMAATVFLRLTQPPLQLLSLCIVASFAVQAWLRRAKSGL